MTDATLRFAAPLYPGGRMCLICGSATVGAVFPPAGEAQHRHPWVWRVWVTSDLKTREGRAKSEYAAKNAAMAAFKDFLRMAGLEVRRDA